MTTAAAAASLAELVEIQRLQHVDLPAARDRAAAWMRAECALDVSEVEVIPRPTSLNSFSGFAVVDGRRLFFKSHIDPDGAVSEYYNSRILADAGYHVVEPAYSAQDAGRQIVFYPAIDLPLMFDAVRREERLGGGGTGAAALVAAERRECDRLRESYAATAGPGDGAAPVQQLFWHRLTGGRLDAFYRDSTFAVPGGGSVGFAELCRRPWVVNGVPQDRTLGELLAGARDRLDPARATGTVVGHGDAHYGNVFLDGPDFLYFDPAFAGRHAPALDIAKPLFHNVFAEWMYFPRETAARAAISVTAGDTVEVTYTGVFTPLRRELLAAKEEALVGPVLAGDHALLAAALLCCPLLTMNLADTARFPAAVAWLGLALTVQMGHWGRPQEFAFGPGAS